MLNINGITVRLGGRTILDGATAAIPPGARVGLIGRNGAGKSTLMKAIIGQIEPDAGEIEMPRRTRLGYIAQDAPSGTATPFETVLAADTERERLMIESETCEDPDRLGDVYERLIAIDAYTAPARAASILVGLGFDGEEGAEAGAAAGAEAAADGISAFSDEDAWDVLEEIPNGSAAALVLLEHHWAVGLRDAVARAGGHRVSDGFISPLDLIAIGLVSADEAAQLHQAEMAG